MKIKDKLSAYIKDTVNINDQVDVEAASKSIRSNIYFRGPNVWILAFSIVIASVGLNVNSTAVIIGAMLISPLMGPIIGMGLGLGTNDAKLLGDGTKNLLIMVIISLLASFLYFFLSPLNLANPTELEARTTPTIYDVIIALFGGFAGILEQARKEKGTVLSGVAIATALMPPLCTAGYGLAKLNMHFFLGAMGLFLINTVFIIFATYVSCKFFHFKHKIFTDEASERRTRRMISAIIVLIIVPSIWSAIIMIRNNNFIVNVEQFLTENRVFGKSYIYDYKIETGAKRHAVVYVTGEELDKDTKKELTRIAGNYGIAEDELDIKEHMISGEDKSNVIMQNMYERMDKELTAKDSKIDELSRQIEILQGESIPYVQITREAIAQQPAIVRMSISKGASVDTDNISKESYTVIAYCSETPDESSIRTLKDWMKVRLNAENLEFIIKDSQELAGTEEKK